FLLQLSADLPEPLLDGQPFLGLPDLLRAGRNLLLLLADPILITAAENGLDVVRQRHTGALADELEDVLHDFVLIRHEFLPGSDHRLALISLRRSGSWMLREAATDSR